MGQTVNVGFGFQRVTIGYIEAKGGDQEPEYNEVLSEPESFK